MIYEHFLESINISLGKNEIVSPIAFIFKMNVYLLSTILLQIVVKILAILRAGRRERLPKPMFLKEELSSYIIYFI